MTRRDPPPASPRLRRRPIRRRRHVFLFRHCVRSTPSTVDLLGNNSAPMDASDLTASPLPRWDVPDYWCTESGLAISRNTGRFLLKRILAAPDDGPSVGGCDGGGGDGDGEDWGGGGGGDAARANVTAPPIRVRFVSDAMQRDADTALALMGGMKVAASVSSPPVSVGGLSDLRFDHALFHPLEGEGGNLPPACDRAYTAERMAGDVGRRRGVVPPPSPGLEDTLGLLRRLGGAGPAGPLASLGGAGSGGGNRTGGGGGVGGGLGAPVHAVRLLAQMAFYSRAGGIDPPFLPDATSEQVYRLLAWANYARSVLNVDNVESATGGAVLARAVLDALDRDWAVRLGAGVGDGSGADGGADSVTATVLVGHDSSIDAVATALGLRWKLRRPYYRDRSGELVPTPPNSALHFVRDERTGAVGVSFLYPTFSQRRPKEHGGVEGEWILNRAGVLKSSPIIFVPQVDGDCSSKDEGMTWIVPECGGRNGVDVLRERLLATLERYPEAVECYRKGEGSWPPPLLGSGQSAHQSHNLVAVVILSSACAILTFIGRAVAKRQIVQNWQGSYEKVQGEIEVI